MPVSISTRSVCCILLATFTVSVLADPNDWVNVNYVMQQASSGSSATSSARQSIIKSAGSSAENSPWSVVSKGSIVPPSGNFQDYLSWAPYHWPNCNWCGSGTTHLSNPDGGDTDGDDPGNDPDDDNSDDDDPDGDDDSYEDGDDDDVAVFIGDHSFALSRRRRNVFGSHRRMRKLRQAVSSPVLEIDRRSQYTAETSTGGEQALAPRDIISGVNVSMVPTPTISVPLPNVNITSTSSSIGTIAGTPAPAEAPEKTQDGGGSSCTPSPTKSLAPSATWTTCPYQVHDGKVNPDVRTLPDSPAVVDMSQSVLYNALAYAMTKTSSYSQNAADALEAFFLDSKTGMRPNMNFGQLVRGPGKDYQIGTFTGVLDMRGLVKVINAIALMKAAGSPDWTSARDSAMTSWFKQYLSWLQTSDIGKQVSTKANNHYTFYVSQIAALKMFLGDTDGAKKTLQDYFSNQYLDQVAASGEQPFEAVRTRPYHYRCFNLEAMITNAKIGDQLGLNLWVSPSRYSATIQTALDYTMGLDPKEEDVSDIFSHVAAVAAAYGDPEGKYAAFLQKQLSAYKTTPFWFYDQTAALPNSPAAHGNQKREILDVGRTPARAAYTENVPVEAAREAVDIPFTCPAVFASQPETELDNDIWVNCYQLRPLYSKLVNSTATALMSSLDLV